MPFFSSFTGSFTGGRRRPISIGGGGGGGEFAYSYDNTDYTYSTSLYAPSFSRSITASPRSHDITLDGQWLVIGMPEYDQSANDNNGLVEIYKLVAGSWTLHQTISPNTYDGGNSFKYRWGNTVKFTNDGTRLILDSNGYGSTDNRYGAFFVYDYNAVSGNWEFVERHRPSVDASLTTFLRFVEVGNYNRLDISSNGDLIMMQQNTLEGGTMANWVVVYTKDPITGSYSYTDKHQLPRSTDSSQGHVAMSDYGHIIIGGPDSSWQNAAGGAMWAYYDIGAGTFKSSLASLSGTIGDPGSDVAMARDGSVFAVMDMNQSAIWLWEWDAGTETYSEIQRLSNASELSTQPVSVHLSPDGERLIVTYPSSPLQVFDKDSGTGLFVESSSTAGFAPHTQWAASMSRDLKYLAIVTNSINVYQGVASGGGGGAATYSLDGASVSSTFTTSAAPYHFQFNADGTEITGTFGSDLLYTTSLSTPYDPTTGSYSISNPSHQLGIGALGASTIYGFRFNDDGTKAFFTHQTILTPSRGQVTEYSLSTPYDISTLSSTGTTAYDTEGDFAATDLLNINSIAFNADGTKMFLQSADSIAGLGIFEYDLSSAYTLSTASYSRGYFYTSVLPTNLLPQNILFNNAGTKLYVTDFRYDSIYEFDLSTGFDLSTISYNNVSLNFAATDTFPRQMMLSQDETQMYIMGSQNNNIYTLDLVQE